MKKLLYIAALATFVSCSDIAENDRFIYVEPTDAKRAILLEDFTGQLCINCPNAAEEIEGLKDTYGDSVVIAVGIHCGLSVKPGQVKGYQGLWTEIGENYRSHWKIDAQPMGLINRTGGVLSMEQWSTAVREELQKEPTVQMSGTLQYNEGVGSGDISLIGLKNIQGKLQLWVIEDSISSIQQLPGRNNYNYSYNHMHVFRTAINGEWGEEISLKQGVSETRRFSFPLDTIWNVENLSVVAFVYNDQGVQQVAQIH